MFLGSVFLNTLLKDYETNIMINGVERCIAGIERLQAAIKPYHKHVLYVVEKPEELDALELIEDMFLLILNPERKKLKADILQPDKKVNIIEVFSDQSNAIFPILRNAINDNVGVGLLSTDVLDYLFYNRNIQDMVDDVSKAFNNPIFVFDAGHTVVAASWEMAKADEVTNRLAENKRITDFEYEVIYGGRIDHTKLLAETKAVEVFHPEFGHKQIVCPIDPERNLGMICVSEILRPFEKTDRKLLEMFRDGVSQKLKYDEFVRNNKGFPYEYFIRDLLDQKIAYSGSFEWQFDYVAKEFSENMKIMVIETARSAACINPHIIRQDMESLRPDIKTVNYKGEIIVFFCMQQGEFLSDTLSEQLNCYCREKKLFAGMSNAFSSLKELFDYYKQALRALELGTAKMKQPGLYHYSENQLRHVINVFLQTEQETAFCHQKLKTLLAYDAEHSTNYAETLYTYLVYERSNIQAAKALFLHKNTLVYRMQKIDELVHINYEDYNERMYLLLSYEMHRAIAQCETDSPI